MSLYFYNQWPILLIALSSLLASTEIGVYFAKRVRSYIDDGAKSQITAIEAAVLGLLALLLGFTFAMAVSRYDLRKNLVLEEANAISTTYLRASFLDPELQENTKRLLRKYVDARLEFYNAGANQAAVLNALQKSKDLEKQIWAYAVEASKVNPQSITIGLFVQSLNEMIDLNAKRITALENHVPEIIWLLLFTISILAALSVGYASGFGNRRNFFSTLVMPLVLALVMSIILDLDRPRRGLIKVSQTSMLRLQSDLNKDF